jgi:UV excision repair protein RAD23
VTPWILDFSLTPRQGIPESALQEQQQAPQAQGSAPTSPPPATGGNTGSAAVPTEGDAPINLFEAAAQAGQNRGGAGGARSGGAGGAASGAAAALGGNSLDFLRNNPQFQQLRQVVQQQPAQLISQHPEQFLQLLAEDADEDVPLPPGAQAISVTEEEREAIERVS